MVPSIAQAITGEQPTAPAASPQAGVGPTTAAARQEASRPRTEHLGAAIGVAGRMIGFVLGPKGPYPRRSLCVVAKKIDAM
ncbi:hypothetical protein ACFYOY_18990 [Streptomyces sp. NPDC007875]|uniref:hypothetical protein n=1 Tax=Streptomyces sp. NPDC007875 TaxID=3364783 RepID=UPI0036B37B87